MCIRKATNNDYQIIRKLPVSLTAKPLTAILPKHFRVLVQEAAVRLLVFQETENVSALMALRLMPAAESGIRFLHIEHLGLDRHAYKSGIADRLEADACLIAYQQLCKAVLVKAENLPEKIVSFYQNRGYVMESELLIKKLA